MNEIKEGGVEEVLSKHLKPNAVKAISQLMQNDPNRWALVDWIINKNPGKNILGEGTPIGRWAKLFANNRGFLSTEQGIDPTKGKEAQNSAQMIENQKESLTAVLSFVFPFQENNDLKTPFKEFVHATTDFIHAFYRHICKTHDYFRKPVIDEGSTFDRKHDNFSLAKDQSSLSAITNKDNRPKTGVIQEGESNASDVQEDVYQELTRLFQEYIQGECEKEYRKVNRLALNLDKLV